MSVRPTLSFLRFRGTPPYAYVLATGLPFAALFIAAAATAVSGRQVFIPAAYLAIFVVALYGGVVPGLVSLTFAVGIDLVLQLRAVVPITSDGPIDGWRIIVLVVGGAAASLAAGLVQDARERAEQASRDEDAARDAADRAAARSAALAELSAESRSRAEASRQRLDLLADAGRILGSSLDYSATLPALAGLTVPLLGDVCVMDVTGEPRRNVVGGELVDELAIERLASRSTEYELDADAAAALRDGRSAVVRLDGQGGHTLDSEPGSAQAAMTPAQRRAAASHTPVSHLESGSSAAEGLRSLRMRVAMVVPIRIRDQLLGTMTFASANADRHYEAADLSTAEVLAQRAAKAIDNGRLHTEIQRLAAHAQERAAELESVVTAIGEGILVCGPDGVVRVANAAAERMLGRTIASVDDLRQRLHRHAEPVPIGVAYGPAEFHLTDRHSGWIELTAYPVERTPTPDDDGTSTTLALLADAATSPSEPSPDRKPETVATVYVLRDVSAFRQGQRLREAFLGLLSHELRTPVTTIYAAANVLARPASTIENDTRQEILRDMIGESDRLYRLVEDLMVLARFDEGIELSKDPNLLQHLVPSVIDTERGRWPQVRFAFDRDAGLPAVSGDETSIQQVLRNLLSNAAKYSPMGSTVLVRIDAERDGVTVHVLDEGPGIRPEEAEELFDPFYRSPTTAAMAGGAGIGLYVSRRLTDAMGGRIWAEQRVSGGAEFCFWLPRYVPSPEDLTVDDVPTEPTQEARPTAGMPMPGLESHPAAGESAASAQAAGSAPSAPTLPEPERTRT